MSLTTIDFERLALQPGERVLDLGCGEGRHSILAYLDNEVAVTGLDLGHEDLRTSNSRFAEFHDPDDESRTLNFVRGSGLHLPFGDHTFDVIVCAEVLEHIIPYKEVLAEIRRVLKPGGRLAISVPRFGPERVCWSLSDAYHEVPGGHVRIFKARELRADIESFEFALQARHWAHALHVPYWWLKCLFWETADENPLVRAYHRFLVWDLMQAPRLTRWLDRLLNPIFGKSVVMYFSDDSVAAPQS